jgi:hypothetical protein
MDAIRQSPISQLRRRAEDNLTAANRQLHSVLSKDGEKSALSAEFPDSSNVKSFELHAAALERTLERLQAEMATRHIDRDTTSTMNEIIRKFFQATYPFARLFLSVARDGSSVPTQIRFPH